jgi:transcription initiation factor TFIIB
MKPADNVIICPNCGDGQKIIDVESGELICTKCGFVIHERVGDEQEDWSILAREPNSKLRTSPTSLARSGMGLSTIIGRPDKSAGSGLNAAMRSTFDRLRAWDFRVKGQDERSLRRVQREMGISGTLDDIIKATNTKEKDLARAYRILLRELDLKVPMLDPIKCVSRVANKANISERTKRRAMEMIHDVVKSGQAAGKDPMGLAASVLYLACVGSNEPKSQVAIAEAAGVSEVTLRKNQRMIMGIRQQPPEAVL